MKPIGCFKSRLPNWAVAVCRRAVLLIVVTTTWHVLKNRPDYLKRDEDLYHNVDVIPHALESFSDDKYDLYRGEFLYDFASLVPGTW